LGRGRCGNEALLDGAIKDVQKPLRQR
jgi:hypothetical protein